MPDSQLPEFPSFPPRTANSDPEELQKYLNKIYTFAVQSAEKNIKWYSDHAGPNSKNARAIRFSAIFFVALAGITPLISVTGVFPDYTQLLTQISYIFIGVAAFLVGVDRFFGYSSSWMRYITTQIELETLLAEFRYKWAVESVKVCDNLTKDNCSNLLNLVQKFTSDVQSKMKEETKAWTTELSNNLGDMEKKVAELEEKLKEKTEGTRQGNASPTPGSTTGTASTTPEENKQPKTDSPKPSGQSPQPTGTATMLTARATDPENDPITA